MEPFAGFGIIAILIIGGTQLLGLGIIGEYLGRLHLNVNRKPQYRVRQESAEGRAPTHRVDRAHDREARPRVASGERSHVD